MDSDEHDEPTDCDADIGRVPDAAEIARHKEFLNQTRLYVDQAVFLVQSVVERMRLGEDVSRHDAERSALALMAALQTYFTLRMRLADETRERDVEADVSDAEPEIDLDDAKRKVARLLDRLRESDDPDEISDGS